MTSDMNSATVLSSQLRSPVPPVQIAGSGQTCWRDLLGRVIGTLERLPALTEEKFLLVGARLREISTGLKTITENAAEAGRIMSGEEVLTVIGELETLFAEMEDYFFAADLAAEQAGGALSDILQELNQMHRLMVGFKDQVSSLRMLKMLTNIQSASLAGRGGFSNVATDIGNLSQNVQARSTAIIAKITGLRSDLAKAVGMVAAFAGRQQHLGKMVIAAMRKDIATLAAMNTNCSGGTGDVSREAGTILREVNNLVVSLQFQDITRQQMEHSRDALEGVRGQFHGDSSGGGTDMGNAAGICALQSAQLTHSAAELQAAVRDISTSLRSIAVRAGASAASVHGLFVLADEVGQASIGDIERELAAISDAFAENLVTNRNLTATMLSVTVAMEEITAFAEDINFMGTEIRLIALNAIIKAVQAGRDGVAFSVIAESVKRQSVELCAQAGAVVANIEAINRHIDALHLTLGDERATAGGGDAGALHQERLAATFAMLKQFNGSVKQLLAQTDQASAALLQCIDRALVSLDSGEISALLERDVIAGLEQLLRAMGPVALASEGTATVARLDSHAGRYTMGSERKVHQLFAATLAGRSLVEGAADQATSAVSRGGMFGDNVELF